MFPLIFWSLILQEASRTPCPLCVLVLFPLSIIGVSYTHQEDLPIGLNLDSREYEILSSLKLDSLNITLISAFCGVFFAKETVVEVAAGKCDDSTVLPWWKLQLRATFLEKVAIKVDPSWSWLSLTGFINSWPKRGFLLFVLYKIHFQIFKYYFQWLGQMLSSPYYCDLLFLLLSG